MGVITSGTHAQRVGGGAPRVDRVAHLWLGLGVGVGLGVGLGVGVGLGLGLGLGLEG